MCEAREEIQVTEKTRKTSLPVREVGHRRLEDYAAVTGSGPVEEIRELAAGLKGKTVLHLNSSPRGGGVADILEALIPLLNDVGVEAEWRTIRGEAPFFDVTKSMHNSLQGKRVEWTAEMWDTWLEYNRRNAGDLYAEYDIVFVHDPQPAPILHFMGDRRGSDTKWIWRCHIDLTDAQPEVWANLQDYIRLYDAAEFSMKEFIIGGYGGPTAVVSAPGIDPLDEKNVPLTWTEAARVLEPFGVDSKRPIMAQVSRFDPWKDPLGVVDAYRLVKKEVPGIQLIMIGPTAADDPEGLGFFEKTARRAGEDPDVHLITNFKGMTDREVNAVQTLARVMVQKSTREGFGLSATGSLWHGKPVIAGRAGGLTLQVLDGKTGFLIESTEECEEKALSVLQDSAMAEEMGRQAREHVRENFLITRVLRDNLCLYRRVLGVG